MIKVKYREDTRPKGQLESSKQQHRGDHDLCRHLSRASAQVTLHTILLRVGGVMYTPHTLEPLKERKNRKDKSTLAKKPRALRKGSMCEGRPGMERTKIASGRLWCRAEEAVPVGKNQSGIAREMFSGT
eukprot:1139512-Pelagomonas_calceolata.AAC.3